MERAATDPGIEHQALAQAPARELLCAADLRVQYGRFLALAGVSLRVEAGELLGLVGPNGAGKTTLLRAMAGLQPPNSGAVWVLGNRLVPGESEAMQHVGFTADEPPLYEAMSVRTFLRFIAAGYGSVGTEVDERIDFWLERLWLAEKADQLIGALSRGMRQRIGIARTLLPNPQVILLDEPAAGLDPAGRAQFRELLMSLRRQGRALVVSSHILSDLAEYCSHVAIMARGRIVRYGTVAEVSEGDSQTQIADYMIRFAAPLTPEMIAMLRAIDGIDSVRVHEDKAQVAARAGKDAAAKLLADVVAAGLPVCSFSIEGGGLEQAYLRSGIGQVD